MNLKAKRNGKSAFLHIAALATKNLTFLCRSSDSIKPQTYDEHEDSVYGIT